MALRPAALIFRRGPVAGAGSPSVVRIARSSATCASKRRFCSSKPRMAASIISSVSFEVGILQFTHLTFCHDFDLCSRRISVGEAPSRAQGRLTVRLRYTAAARLSRGGLAESLIQDLGPVGAIGLGFGGR